VELWDARPLEDELMLAKKVNARTPNDLFWTRLGRWNATRLVPGEAAPYPSVSFDFEPRPTSFWDNVDPFDERLRGKLVSMETGVLAAAEGRSIWEIGDRYTIKCDGNDTSGAFALVEAVVAPGNGPPPHVHSREDEGFYILEDEIQFHADGRSFMATTVAWVTLAKGSLHCFQKHRPEARPNVDHGDACRTGELFPRSRERGHRRGNRTRDLDARGYPETPSRRSEVRT
jgi:mannose-6-phosphate isomerase-like protein (cupin superfamily)